MKKLLKVKPMFNRIITTMDVYEKDQYNGHVIDTTKQKGSLKEYQTVLSVGTTVRDIKEGDLVCIDPTRYMVTKHRDKSLHNNIVGDEVSIGYKFNTIKLDDKEYTTKVGGSTENYIMHYIYMSKKLYNSDSYNTMFVKVDNLNEETRKDLSKRLKEYDSVSKLTYNSLSRTVFDEAMENFGQVSGILIVSAGLLAFVVLYNLSSINISERKRELASIKVLGFYDNEVYNYIGRENKILTFIGMLLGCFVGYALTMHIIKTCELDITMFSPKISIYSYIYSLGITLIFTILVDIATYFSLKHIKMVESLKSVE